MKKVYKLILVLILSCSGLISSAQGIDAGDQAVLKALFESFPQLGWVWVKDNGNVDQVKIITEPINPFANNYYVEKDNGSKDSRVEINTQAKITKINLSGMNLSGTMPENFNPPAGVQALTMLEELNVSNNGAIDGTITANLLGFLSNAKILNVSNTQISGALPEFLASKTWNMEELYFSKCGISSIPSSISNLTKLKKLNLSSNNLTTLPAGIYDLTALETLNFSKNQIESFPSGSSAVSAVINGAKNRMDFCAIENLYAGFPNASSIDASDQESSTGLNPQTVNVAFGDNYTANANICGTSNTYQWQRSFEHTDNRGTGGYWQDITGATAASYTLTSIENNMLLRCKVTGASQNVIYTKNLAIKVGPDLAPDIEFEIAEDGTKTNRQFPNLKTARELRRLNASDLEIVIDKTSLTNITIQQQNVKVSSYYTFRPAANYNGTEETTYTVTANGKTYTGKITFIVTPVNDAPSLSIQPPADLTVQFGSSLEIPFTYSDAIDGDAACNTFNLKSSSSASSSIEVDMNAGKLLYKPSKNPISGDEITDKIVLYAYEKCDKQSLTSNKVQLTISISHLSTNNAPVVTSTLQWNLYPGASLASQKLPIEDETPYDKLTIVSDKTSLSGTLTKNKNLFTYKAPNDPVSTSWTYTVTDAGDPAKSGAGTVNINVAYPQKIDFSECSGIQCFNKRL